ARSGPTDPRTLTRAARAARDKHPDFAVEAALIALHWIAEGHGFEITFVDVLAAREAAIDAAKRSGALTEVLERIAKITTGKSRNARWIAGTFDRMGL